MLANTGSLSPIEKVVHQLKSASGPASALVHGNDNFSAIVIGFNKGDFLPEHTTTTPATITVLKGCVTYIDADDEIPLFEYDAHAIPVNVVHSVRANRRSICLLVRG